MAVGTVGSLHWADILVICAYFVFVLVVGLWSSCRAGRDSVKGYFLAGGNMHWLLVGASLFASNIGSGHFVGLAGSGAASGIGVSGFELNAIFILLLLGWIFIPVYMASGVYTMPEYLKKRFGGKRIRVYLSCLSLLLYIFTKISADLFAGAIFIKQSLDWDLYASIGILLLIAAIFTSAGGLTAVIWTDAVQVVIMIIGAFILMGISFNKVGGYSNLVVDFFRAVPNETYIVPHTDCHIPPEHSMNLLRAHDQDDLPWTGMVFGLTISSVWYWCSDQVIVQRALAAKNFSHAKAGCILAGWLKFLPMWLLVLPGMAARVLYPNSVACTDPDECYRICESKAGCTNIAYPLLVIKLMPPGLRGLMLAVMMSALMSSLTSIFNSSSTIFAIDIWKTLIRKKASKNELLIVGKVFVIVLVAVSILWIPIIKAFSDSQLFNYIQAVTSYLAPPVCAVYVLALFVPRVNEPGAFWGLMMGLLVGLARFITQISFTAPLCGQQETRPLIIRKVHYLHFGILLFFLTCIITIVVSLLTEPVDEKKLHRLTFWTRMEPAVGLSSSCDTNGNAGQGGVAVIDCNSSTLRVQEPPVHRDEPEKASFAKKALQVLCGVDMINEDKQPEAVETFEAPQPLYEKLRTKRCLDILALVTATCTVFYWVFYA